jgi:2'-5' RNA ligase
MRLFVAVDVDRGTREAARALRDGVRRDRPAVDRVLRWVDPGNLHLTLQFLGEQEDAVAIAEHLSSLSEVPSFDLGWGTPAWLPPRGRPRVFYVSLSQGAADLSRLAEAASRHLSALGLRPEDRPFTPHLTLARVRDDFRREARALAREPAAAPAHALASGVDRVLLIESRLSPGGPDYQVRSRIDLGAGDGR